MDGPWQMEYKTAMQYGMVAKEAAKLMRWIDPGIELAACGSSGRNMPTFGRWEGVQLDDVDRRALYVSEGIGHGYCALTDDATITYLCSETYNPAGEHGIHPLDPELGIVWPVDEPQLSARDAGAPSLAEMRAAGRLPDFTTCEAYTQSLRAQ